MEHRTNKSIREEFKVENQWLKDFIKKQEAKLKYFGYLSFLEASWHSMNLAIV